MRSAPCVERAYLLPTRVVIRIDIIDTERPDELDLHDRFLIPGPHKVSLIGGHDRERTDFPISPLEVSNLSPRRGQCYRATLLRFLCEDVSAVDVGGSREI